ncbi:DoxX family protein [Solicola gregarius]|uniref:DoxX family protein n=1 Tax=Solicola gregarius TaxID=2908642 RepID=A0AA46TIV9_9ACTN|nr:DoxX family protein [Solicola gregarius]UYM06036.1 DoxX family protein [Solicola gregarius]
MTMLRTVARPMLASMFLIGGVNSLRNAKAMAPTAQPFADQIDKLAPDTPVPTDAVTLVRANGAAQVVGGALLATGRVPRLAAFMLAGTLVPTTLGAHRFWDEQDPAVKQNQQVHFFKNVSILGGLLMATLDPDPHKKLLIRRAKDRTVEAADRAVEKVEKIRS